MPQSPITTGALNILGVVLPIIFVILLIAYVVLFIVLKFHWKKYGSPKDKVKALRFIYLSVGLALVLGMFISLVGFYS